MLLPEHLTGIFFWDIPLERVTREDPEQAGETESSLVWEHFEVTQEDLECVAGKRDDWTFLQGLCDLV